MPTDTGTIVNEALLEGRVTDLNPADNSVTEDTEVLPVAGLSLAKTDDMDPVTASEENLTYTLALTNDGPSDATGVTLSDTLPPGVDFVSVVSSQGTCSERGGVVTCNLGNLAAGAAATVNIVVVTPTAEGSIINTATVVANEVDTDMTDNTAQEPTDVVVVPKGRFVITARVFVDYRCNRFFINGLDIPISGVPVTLSFPNGADQTRTTITSGYVYFHGFEVPPEGVTLSVDLLPTFRGCTLGPCFNSLTGIQLERDRFGAFRSRFVHFGAELIP